MPTISHMPGTTNGNFYKAQVIFLRFAVDFLGAASLEPATSRRLTCCCGNPAFCCLTDLGGEFRHGRLILVHIRPKTDASNGVFV
jgi:hypothetical protein